MYYAAKYQKDKVTGKRTGPYWSLVRSKRNGKHIRQIHVRYVGSSPPLQEEKVRESLADPTSELVTGMKIYKEIKEFVCFDLETTGFAGTDAIIEVGMQRFRITEDGLEYLEDQSTLINPGRRIPRQITKLTGITNKDVKDAPRIEEVLPDVRKFIKGHYLVGHNASFDARFLNQQLPVAEQVQDDHIADTLSIARRLYGEDKNTLQDCSDRERVEIKEKQEFHSATYDLKVMAEVFMAMMGKIVSLPTTQPP